MGSFLQTKSLFNFYQKYNFLLSLFLPWGKFIQTRNHGKKNSIKKRTSP